MTETVVTPGAIRVTSVTVQPPREVRVVASDANRPQALEVTLNPVVGPVGPPGNPGPASTQPGPPGPQGPPGPEGPIGTKRHYGAGPPGVVIGASPYDEYVDTVSGTLYVLE